MSIAGQSNFDVPSGISLRSELSLRNLRFASVNGLLHERTDGQVPSIIFGRTDDGRHGNFHPEAYKSICDNPEWAKRLAKFTPRRGDREFVPIGNGKNWTAPIAPMHCS